MPYKLCMLIKPGKTDKHWYVPVKYAIEDAVLDFRFKENQSWDCGWKVLNTSGEVEPCSHFAKSSGLQKVRTRRWRISELKKDDLPFIFCKIERGAVKKVLAIPREFAINGNVLDYHGTRRPGWSTTWTVIEIREKVGEDGVARHAISRKWRIHEEETEKEVA